MKQRKYYASCEQHERKLIDLTGEPAMLELLAEECAELAHAALKLARKYRGENPTPRSEAECLHALEEEIADVSTCVGQLDGIVDMDRVIDIAKKKLDRWWQRADHQDAKMEAMNE